MNHMLEPCFYVDCLEPIHSYFVLCRGPDGVAIRIAECGPGPDGRDRAFRIAECLNACRGILEPEKTIAAATRACDRIVKDHIDASRGRPRCKFCHQDIGNHARTCSAPDAMTFLAKLETQNAQVSPD